ncbi:MAG: hypothetical protein NC133_00400 [Prevotella sp.]|nr:hypothetical protein [Prevotella sp.]
MDNKNYVGKIVTLKKDFIEKAKMVDECFPNKFTRPYLIVEIPTKKGGQLFAVPMQTSVGKETKGMFFEKLAHRLEAWKDCESGLVFSQMVPITNAQIDNVKAAESNIPVDDKKRRAILCNVRDRDSDKIPVKAQPAFNFLKKMVNSKIDVFSNPNFKKAYRTVADEIFRETIRIKNQKFELITKKAENYLRYYVGFLQQSIYKKRKVNNGKRIILPRLYTRIDNLVKFVREFNAANNETVKTSLQQDKSKESVDKKSELTPGQFAIAERLADKKGKPTEEVVKVMLHVRNDDILAEKKAKAPMQTVAAKTVARALEKKPVTKTQEKIAPKQPKKNNSQNSR